MKIWPDTWFIWRYLFILGPPKTLKMVPNDVVSHLHKNDVTILKKLMKMLIRFSIPQTGLNLWKYDQIHELFNGIYPFWVHLKPSKMEINDVISHLHKMTSPSLKKLVTKFFWFSILQTIDSSKESKMIMKFPRKRHFWHKAPDYIAN